MIKNLPIAKALQKELQKKIKEQFLIECDQNEKFQQRVDHE
jgi:hypothetical protein